MTDPREEIAQAAYDWFGADEKDADDFADALLPLFLRERERAEAAGARARRAEETRENANRVSVRVELENKSLRARAERAEAALEEAREVLALIYVMLTGAEPMWAEMPWDERCARAANEAQAAFTALDRLPVALPDPAEKPQRWYPGLDDPRDESVQHYHDWRTDDAESRAAGQHTWRCSDCGRTTTKPIPIAPDTPMDGWPPVAPEPERRERIAAYLRSRGVRLHDDVIDGLAALPVALPDPAEKRGLIARVIAGIPRCCCSDDWRQSPYNGCPIHGSGEWPAKHHLAKADEVIAVLAAAVPVPPERTDDATRS